MSVIVISILKVWLAVRTGLEKLRSPSFADAVADINGQLESLVPSNFIESVQRPWFDNLPRYLKALGKRVERLPANARRDAELVAKVKPFVSGLRGLLTELTRPSIPSAVTQLRWMIEEYRVSLFAQELKTVTKVSEKRLAEQLEAARVEVRA